MAHFFALTAWFAIKYRCRSAILYADNRHQQSASTIGINNGDQGGMDAI
jgi:hypothetical protein